MINNSSKIAPPPNADIKDVRTIRRKDDKSETEAISRHSERQRRNPADYYNVSNSNGIHMKNFPETDHASKPLGIFTSKSVSDVGIASWNYFSLVTAIHIAVADMNFVTRSPSCTLVRNSAIPTYFKNLAAKTLHKCMKYKTMLLQRATCVAPLPSRLAAKRVAFTLAEVLITLGIIGVVAALTIPSIINKIKHKELETGFQKAYSTFSQGVINMKREDGEGLAKYYAYYNPDTQTNPNADEFFKRFYQYSGVKVIGKCNYKNITIKNYTKNAEAKSYCIHNSNKVDGSCSYVDLAEELSNGMCSALTITASTIFIIVDTNGMKGPNLLGHDIFFFKVDKNDNLIPIKMAKLYTDEELEDESMPTWSYVAGDPCSIKSKQAGNGTGCSYYALINQNPDDASKGYWESLP